MNKSMEALNMYLSFRFSVVIPLSSTKKLQFRDEIRNYYVNYQVLWTKILLNFMIITIQFITQFKLCYIFNFGGEGKVWLYSKYDQTTPDYMLNVTSTGGQDPIYTRDEISNSHMQGLFLYSFSHSLSHCLSLSLAPNIHFLTWWLRNVVCLVSEKVFKIWVVEIH